MNTITPRSETEALLHEKLQSLLADLDTVGDNAQYGYVLDDMDDFLFTAIRKLAAETLEKKIQERINAAKQTAEPKQCPHCKKTEVRKTRTKTLTTSNNHNEWDSRELPKPTVNMAMATLDKIDEFTERCKAFRFNLGVGGNVSVLGDGAHWIWNFVSEVVRQYGGVFGHISRFGTH